MLNQLISRRQALKATGCGFGYLALADLLARESARAATNPLADRPGHHPAKAKRMIFLFMQGGVSHVDSFDYKPALIKHDGEAHSFDDARTLAKTGKIIKHQVMKPLWRFRNYGESGLPVSDLFPEIGKRADDLCVLRGLHTEGIAHGPATLFLHTGSINLIRPSMGSWVMYGLGSENENLPGFVTLSPSMGNGGPRNYANAFLPTVYQGTAVGRAGIAAKDASIRDLVNRQVAMSDQDAQFELLQALNAEQAGPSRDAEIDAVINSFEMGYRMQRNAPEVLDLAKEDPRTLKMYGIGEKATDNYGRLCLMARRMVETGVRYVQVNYGDNTNNPAWDQHSNMPKHADHAKAVDQPIAALLTDLKQRGLLEDTLVWWGGEFGRTPYSQNKGTGRDHNPSGFTVFLAGGGTKPGFTYGVTDDFGHHAIEGKIHMHDLHATILHLLGLDHEQLTYRYAGRDFRLTDVAGRVVDEIIA